MKPSLKQAKKKNPGFKRREKSSDLKRKKYASVFKKKLRASRPVSEVTEYQVQNQPVQTEQKENIFQNTVVWGSFRTDFTESFISIQPMLQKEKVKIQFDLEQKIQQKYQKEKEFQIEQLQKIFLLEKEVMEEKFQNKIKEIQEKFQQRLKLKQAETRKIVVRELQGYYEEEIAKRELKSKDELYKEKFQQKLKLKQAETRKIVVRELQGYYEEEIAKRQLKSKDELYNKLRMANQKLRAESMKLQEEFGVCKKCKAFQKKKKEIFSKLGDLRSYLEVN